MPALQNLVLTDRATTPVAHTFVPQGLKAGVAEVAELTGVPIADKRFSISRRTSTTRYKATIKLTVPIVQTQTVNGITSPVVVRTAYASATFDFANSSTEQERADCVGMFMTSMGATMTLVNSTVVKLEGLWG